MLFYEEAFSVSALSSKTANPAVKDIQEANSILRLILKQQCASLMFEAGIDPEQLCLLVVHDATFYNLPQHKSQRGHFVLVTDKRIAADHDNLYQVHCIGWQSSRIQRAVGSTLAAEAYSASDAIDTLDWARAVLL